MPQLSFVRRLKAYFSADVHSGDFAYVLWPFLRLFKACGYAPIKLSGAEGAEAGGASSGATSMRRRCERVEWDRTAWLWNGIGCLSYIMGFAVGVHHLGHTRNWHKLYETSIITFFTSWAQIVTLFVLGGVDLISAWTHMGSLRRVCVLIYKVDDLLSGIPDIFVDYKPLRSKLLLQLALCLLVPLLTSMVNCIVIERETESMVFMGTCFWFICFAPIMLVTIKEFQFFSLLFVLKSKFKLVNRKLKFCVSGTYRQQVLQQQMRRLNSTSEMPLTSVVVVGSPQHDAPGTPTLAAVEPIGAEELGVETLKKLFEIYSLIADAVELTLRIFAWHLLLLTATSIGVVTIQSYNLFMLIAHSLALAPLQVIFIVMWIGVQLVAVGINVSACSMTSRTMARTGPLLHKIRLQPGAEASGVPFYQVLQLFSMEVLQRKNNFTAAGFFDINYKLITSIFAAVTTYLVIIIQFHLTNIPDVHFHEPPL